MTNNLRKPPSLSDDLLVDFLGNLSATALNMAEVAHQFDIKDGFENNMPDIITAQAVVSANDSNITMQVLKDQMMDNGIEMVRPSLQNRVAKATAGFQDNMNVVYKSIITKTGLRRGFETNFDNNVIKVRFGPNPKVA